MSHIQKSETQMSSEAGIFKAIERLENRLKAQGKEVELTINKNACPRYYYGAGEKCDLVLTLPGRYDLGFKKQENGTYGLVADEELMRGSGQRGSAASLIGIGGSELLKEYMCGVAITELESQGYEVSATLLESGVYEIEGEQLEVQSYGL